MGTPNTPFGVEVQWIRPLWDTTAPNRDPFGGLPSPVFKTGLRDTISFELGMEKLEGNFELRDPSSSSGITKLLEDRAYYHMIHKHYRRNRWRDKSERRRRKAARTRTGRK